MQLSLQLNIFQFCSIAVIICITLTPLGTDNVNTHTDTTHDQQIIRSEQTISFVIPVQVPARVIITWQYKTDKLVLSLAYKIDKLVLRLTI